MVGTPCAAAGHGKPPGGRDPGRSFEFNFHAGHAHSTGLLPARLANSPVRQARKAGSSPGETVPPGSPRGVRFRDQEHDEDGLDKVLEPLVLAPLADDRQKDDGGDGKKDSQGAPEVSPAVPDRPGDRGRYQEAGEDGSRKETIVDRAVGILSTMTFLE